MLCCGFFFVAGVLSSFVSHIKPCHQHLSLKCCRRFSSLIWSVGEFPSIFPFFFSFFKSLLKTVMVQRWRDIFAIVPFVGNLANPMYNLPWRRPWNQVKGERCYPSYIMHNASRWANVDDINSLNWLQKQTLLCISQSVSQILLEQVILAWLASLGLLQHYGCFVFNIMAPNYIPWKVLAQYRVGLFLSLFI